MEKRPFQALVIALPFIAVAIFSPAGYGVFEKGTPVRLTETPAAVQSALAQVAAGAAIDQIKQKSWNRATMYEATILNPDATADIVQVGADGTLIGYRRHL